MNEETRIALEDVFIDKDNMDARQYIFGEIKKACQDAKRSIRAGVTPVNKITEEGQLKQEDYKLKGIDLEKFTLESNPSWLPKNLDKEDNTPIELKLGDNSMKYLKIFGQLVTIRHEQFNIAQDEYLEIQKVEMREKVVDNKQYDRWVKGQADNRKDRLELVPHCLEQAIFTSIWPQITRTIDSADGVMFEKEFKEIYKEKAEEKPKPTAQ